MEKLVKKIIYNNMKILGFLIALFLISCSTRQDFESDLTIPQIMKDYHQEQKLAK
jgi:hypothetical protein